MRTSATGRSEAKRAGQAGFTLVEILVALAIVAILAGGVALTLPDPARTAQQATAQALHAQAASAARHARSEAQPWAWQVDADGGRLLVAADGRWQAAGKPVSSSGLAVGGPEIDGVRRPPGSAIVFAAVPPIFAVDLQGDGRRWRVAGQPNGRVTLEQLQ